MVSIEDMLRKGYPALPGEWQPWHDGLDLIQAVNMELGEKSLNISSERVNDICSRFVGEIMAGLDKYLYLPLTESTVYDMYAEVSRISHQSSIMAELPVKLSPVLFLRNNGSIAILWRSKRRENETLPRTSSGDAPMI
jgi:hypothetical protein